jgi:hypothetical protein
MYNILISMSTRLQVILDKVEMAEIRRAAAQQRMTVAEWVRQNLRAARRHLPTTDSGRKIAVIRAATGHQFPTADIEVMLAEIERGYNTRPPS